MAYVTDCDYCGEISLCREDGVGGKGCRSCLNSHKEIIMSCKCAFCGDDIGQFVPVLVGSEPMHAGCAEEMANELWGDEDMDTMGEFSDEEIDPDGYDGYEDDGMSDVEADADTLRMAGYGCDEDYGYYGDEDCGYDTDFGMDY